MQNEQTPAAGPSLLPCPFCGSAHIVPLDYKMWCESCHAYGPPVMRGDKVAAWNTRRPHLPSPASSSSVVQGDASGVEEMFGVTGASDEAEALAYAIWAHRCPGLLMDEDDDRPHYMEAAKAAFAALDGNAPTAPASRPAGEGETTQHTPRCWGRTSYSDEMAHCHCKPAGEGEREAVAILKGIGKIDGDGWKDTTTKGEVVYVWNAEKPSPYAPGQYPRIGNEGWSASTSQYDFTPATADDVPAILALIRPAAPGGGEAWAWLAAHPSMELGHCYGDEDDDPAWQVHERSGNRSDREWRLVASGPTPLEAVLAAIPASEGGEG